MAKRKRSTGGLSEAQVNHRLYDAVADVLHKHPQLCLNDVMSRHRLAIDIARKLHGRCVAPARKGFFGR